MDVLEAITARRSVRAFLDTPVGSALLRKIVVDAAKAPAGGNLQPWHVDIVEVAALVRLKSIMKDRLASGETKAKDIRSIRRR
jgi:nitroreductase